jgi:hypothetical protein
MIKSGLYLVALKSEEPISVNAHDPRIADRCIKVNRLNCKIGKAANLSGRERNYWKTFGADNVVFTPIAFVQEFATAERIVLERLSRWRVRGRTGRKNEWLAGIDPDDVKRIALSALIESGIPFKATSDSEDAVQLCVQEDSGDTERLTAAPRA